MKTASFQLGALIRDGQRQLLLAGEYPYYRDHPARWRTKLEAMRAVGISVVTCYLPWRHHLVSGGGAGGEQRFCFGGVDDNRDVIRFLGLVAELGLLAVVKPGPFVHGEIQLGGLPDFVSPSRDPRREASVDGSGAPQTSQGLALPSALSEDFLRDTGAWLRAVRQQVVADRIYPAGPILAVQLGNEGIYSDANHPAAAFDYSPSAVAGFRRYLAGRYRIIEHLNRCYGTSYQTFDDVGPVRHWSEQQAVAAMLDQGAYLGAYLGEAFRRWAGMLGEVTTIVNLPAPARAQWHPEHADARFDFWLCRVNGRSVPYPIQYGFSSWTGVAAEDDEALINLALTAMRARGPNLEENWGLAWADERCAHGACTVYQAVLSLACGATGYAVYPACATEGWSAAIELDPDFLARTLPDPAVMGPPYGSLAPIAVDGSPAAKYETLRLLNKFFAREGNELLGCVRSRQIVLGLSGSHSQLMAWNPPRHAQHKRLRYPQPLAAVVQSFVRACIDHGVTFGVVDLETASAEELARLDRVVVPGGFFMDQQVQERLASYVEGGGQLLTGWEVPLYNQALDYTDILHERVFGHGFAAGERMTTLQGEGDPREVRALHLPSSARQLASSPDGLHGYSVPRGRGVAHYLDCQLDERSLATLFAASGVARAPVLGPDGKAALVSEYQSADGEQRFTFLLSRSDCAGRFRWPSAGHELALSLPGRGCAVIKTSVRGGAPRVESFFLKAVNELRQQAADDAQVAYGDDLCEGPPGSDVLAYRDSAAWCFETASSTASSPLR